MSKENRRYCLHDIHMDVICDQCSVDNYNALKNVAQDGFSKAATGGIKYDKHKPDLSMVSYELMEEVAKVRMFGAAKYSRDNWKNGFKVTRSLAAALRHIFLFLTGETNDKESGLSHLAHGVCCLEHAIYDMKHHPENDDRNLDSVPKTT